MRVTIPSLRYLALAIIHYSIANVCIDSDVFDPSVLVRNVDVYPYGSEIALTKVNTSKSPTIPPKGMENDVESY